MTEAEKILYKVYGAEEVLSVLIKRGSLREKEAEYLLRPLYLELQKYKSLQMEVKDGNDKHIK